MTKKGYVIFVLIMTAFFMEGCHRADKGSSSMLTGETVIAADEALKPLMETQLDIFHSIYMASSINCKYLPEDSVIKLLIKEDIRLAITGRPLNEDEVAFLKSKELFPESIPLAYDAIALIVPAESGTITLTTDQVKQILSGNITDWSQISNSGKSGNIQLILDTESSGIVRYLNEKLELDNKLSGNFTFAGTNEKVIEIVAGNEGYLGFIGYNWLSETESIKVQEELKRVHLVGLSNQTNEMTADSVYMPSVSNLYNNKYPFIRKVYALYTDPAASLARGFLALLTSDRGQRIIYRNGLRSEHDFQRLIHIKEDF